MEMTRVEEELKELQVKRKFYSDGVNQEETVA